MEIKGLPALPEGYVWRSGMPVKIGEGFTDKFGGIPWKNGRVYWVEGRLYYLRSASRHGETIGYWYTELDSIPAELLEVEEKKEKSPKKSLTIEEIEKREWEEDK